MLGLLLLIVILVVVFGNPHVGGAVYPGYGFGYWPSGVGLVLAIVLILLLVGRL